jgi:hypothetical protein
MVESPFDLSIMIRSHTEVGCGIQIIREGNLEFVAPILESVF